MTHIRQRLDRLESADPSDHIEEVRALVREVGSFPAVMRVLEDYSHYADGVSMGRFERNENVERQFQDEYERRLAESRAAVDTTAGMAGMETP